MFLAERLSPPVLRVGLSLASKQMGSEYPTLHVFFGCGVCAPLRQAKYIDLAGHIQVQAQDSLQKPPVQYPFASGPLEQGLMPDPDLVQWPISKPAQQSASAFQLAFIRTQIYGHY